MSNPDPNQNNPPFPLHDSPDFPLNSTGIPITPCSSCGGAANKRRSPDSSEYNKSFSRNSSSRDLSVDGNFESQWRRKMRGCVEEMNQCFDELMAEKKEEQSYEDKSMAEREPGLVTNAGETVNVERIASLLPHQPIQRCLSDMGFSRTSSSKDLHAGGSSDSKISKQEEYKKSFLGNFSSRDMLVDGSSESQLLLMNNDQWRKRMRDCVEEINWCSDELMAEKKEEQSNEDKAMAEREVILVTNTRERVSVERVESCYILHFKCPCGNCFDILFSGTDCYYKLL